MSADTSPPGRILVILLGAIGDVVRAMPLVSRLRRALPGARLVWAVEPIASPLLEGHPAIDERIVFHRDQGARAFLRFLAALRAVRADWTLDLQRHLKSGIASRASGAGRRIGFDRQNSKEGNWLFQTETIPPQRHFSSKLRQYLAFAGHLGLPEAPIDFGLGAGPADEARADELLSGVSGRFVTAFVGSTWESRFWFPEATAGVLTRLRERHGLAAVLLGSRGEADFARAVLERAPAGTVDLVGKTSLRDLVPIFSRSAVAFGPDSGPMHIAAAVGRPVVSLWGATSPERSAPFASEARTLVGAVACHPCYLRECPIGRACMRTITPGRVLAAIEAALSDPGRNSCLPAKR